MNDAVSLFIIMTYMFLLPGTIIIMLYKIISSLEDLKESNEEIKNKQMRTHPKINKSYDNAFGGKTTGYELYMNENGLYEPVKPSKRNRAKKEGGIKVE